MHNKQSGFTLIELVMVIVILGILAAFALPRFADLTGDARAASISGLAGAMKSAAAIARAEQLASGAALATSVTLDGQLVTMAAGHPTANAAGIIAAASINAATSGTTSDYIYAIGAATPPTITFTIAGFSGSNCNVVYSQAAATGTAISTPYNVTTTTTGC